jgi:hypothetical protein
MSPSELFGTVILDIAMLAVLLLCMGWDGDAPR